MQHYFLYSAVRSFVYALVLLIPIKITAEEGDDNPTGVSGIYNGNVTTAGNYDPYTGNAMRVVDDIVVPGSVGAYPLKWTRYFTSRRRLEAVYMNDGPHAEPTPHYEPMTRWKYSYNDYAIGPRYMEFPDGRSIDGWAEFPSGITERWGSAFDANGIARGAILLADGGKVLFEAENRPIELIDPYGQRTRMTYVIGGHDELGDIYRLDRVTEPGGRYLKVTWRNPDVRLSYAVSRVDAFDGPQNHLLQSVIYTWDLTEGHRTLASVRYDDVTTATYTYTIVQIKIGNITVGHRPVLQTCNDVRYAGPMRQITYEHDPDRNGIITSEKNSSTGAAVSTLLGAGNGSVETQERRGDGPMRTFKYGGGDALSIKKGKLVWYTDFKNDLNQTTNLTYGDWDQPGEGFVTAVTDPNNHITSYTRGNPHSWPPMPWAIYRITHDVDGSHIDQTFTDDDNPYYLASRTDERGKRTDYTRNNPLNPNPNAITRKDYPADESGARPYETFEYNPFGQILTHRFKNGGYQHFDYDSRGLLLTKTNPTWNANRASSLASDPKTTYSYYTTYPWFDRVYRETDPRGLITEYEYDRKPVFGDPAFPNGQSTGDATSGRGLVTKITHVSDNGTYQLFAYDKFGSKVWEENELRQRTTYTYDDYGRVLKIKNPLGKEVVNTYVPTVGTNTSPYVHTTNCNDTTTTPTLVVTRNAYDTNFRKISATVAPGTIQQAITLFEYDFLGNPTKVTDPDGHFTRADYDTRNRKWHVYDALNNTTTFEYDFASNLKKITRPDTSIENKTYDALNRLLTDTVPKEGPPQPESVTTTFEYYPGNAPTMAGELLRVTDGKNQTTTFEYDPSGLQTKMTYPNNVHYQTWTYDSDKNLLGRKTVNATTPVSQLFSYDSRNRPIAMTWSNALDWSIFGFDAASRLTSAQNPSSKITRTYDNAGRLTLDRQQFEILPISAVSRKSQGSGEPYDITLPLTGALGVECRNSASAPNTHLLVVGFPRPIAFSTATVTTGTATVAGTSLGNGGKDVTINLTGVNNAQNVVVTLNNVTDATVTNNVLIGMSVLQGDVNGNGTVNSSDISQVQYDSGHPLDATNFREDVNADGAINSTDVSAMQSVSGTSVPAYTLTQGPSQRVSPPYDVQYFYDDDGKPNRLISPDYDVDYHYDFQGRFDRILRHSDSTPLFTYTYDLASNLRDRKNDITGVHQDYGTPDLLNRITKRDVKLADNSLLSHEAYAYVPQRPGLLASVTRENQVQDTFAYDLMGALKTAQYDVPSGGPAARTCGYVWDKAGNRSSVTDNGVPTSYNTAGNVLNQYLQVGNDSVSNGNNHELIGFQNISYTYINDRFLSSVSGNSHSQQMFYDPLGRCVVRTIDGSTSYYVYDGPRPVVEYGATYVKTAANIYGRGIDEILQRSDYTVTPNRVLYYQDDRQGNITHLMMQVNGTPTIVESYRYDVFGKPTINGGLTYSPLGNRFMFTGREYVSQFGIYEYRHRAYHPGLGRFMSEDPIGFGGGANFFRYCLNNPVNLRDPMGLQSGAPPEAEHSNEEETDEQEQEQQVAEVERLVVTPEGSHFELKAGSAPIPPGPNTNSVSPAPGSAAPAGTSSNSSGAPSTSSGPAGHNGASNPSGNTPVGGPPITPMRVTSTSNPYGPGWKPFRDFLDRPATAEQAAWTDRGRVPTLVAAAVIFAPLAAPEAAAPLIVKGGAVAFAGARVGASWAALQAYYYPGAVVAGGAFVENAAPGSGPMGYTTWPGFWGSYTGEYLGP
jgi:RHS repeat-associated protein